MTELGLYLPVITHLLESGGLVPGFLLTAEADKPVTRAIAAAKDFVQLCLEEFAPSLSTWTQRWIGLHSATHALLSATRS